MCQQNVDGGVNGEAGYGIVRERSYLLMEPLGPAATLM
jgi:hypothetical protein